MGGHTCRIPSLTQVAPRQGPCWPHGGHRVPWGHGGFTDWPTRAWPQRPHLAQVPAGDGDDRGIKRKMGQSGRGKGRRRSMAESELVGLGFGGGRPRLPEHRDRGPPGLERDRGPNLPSPQLGSSVALDRADKPAVSLRPHSSHHECALGPAADQPGAKLAVRLPPHPACAEVTEAEACDPVCTRQALRKIGAHYTSCADPEMVPPQRYATASLKERFTIMCTNNSLSS